MKALVLLSMLIMYVNLTNHSDSGVVSIFQEPLLVQNKQGTFEILSGTDYIFTGCSFPKSEMTANFEEIKKLIGIIQRNEVLTELRGVKGYARIRPADCKDDGQYGVPAELSIEFCDYFKNKNGEITYNSIEPPCWKLIINRVVPIGYGFFSDRFSRNPDIFTVPEKKVTIVPGIDLYDDECVVIYDPDRPEYWLPVTVKEAFDLVFAENKKLKNDIQREMAMKMLNEEWAAIPQTDWNKPATFSGMLSRVGTKTGFPKIMKVNPDY
jgi:hypothetical protein